MVTVTCPVCGKAVPVEQYSSHYDSHQRGQWGRVSPERLPLERRREIMTLAELRKSPYASELKQILGYKEKELIGNLLEERAKFWENQAGSEPAGPSRVENLAHCGARISELIGLADMLGLEDAEKRISTSAQIISFLPRR